MGLRAMADGFGAQGSRTGLRCKKDRPVILHLSHSGEVEARSDEGEGVCQPSRPPRQGSRPPAQRTRGLHNPHGSQGGVRVLASATDTLANQWRGADKSRRGDRPSAPQQRDLHDPHGSQGWCAGARSRHRHADHWHGADKSRRGDRPPPPRQRGLPDPHVSQGWCADARSRHRHADQWHGANKSRRGSRPSAPRTRGLHDPHGSQGGVRMLASATETLASGMVRTSRIAAPGGRHCGSPICTILTVHRVESAWSHPPPRHRRVTWCGQVPARQPAVGTAEAQFARSSRFTGWSPYARIRHRPTGQWHGADKPRRGSRPLAPRQRALHVPHGSQGGVRVGASAPPTPTGHIEADCGPSSRFTRSTPGVRQRSCQFDAGPPARPKPGSRHPHRRVVAPPGQPRRQPLAWSAASWGRVVASGREFYPHRRHRAAGTLPAGQPRGGKSVRQRTGSSCWCHSKVGSRHRAPFPLTNVCGHM